MTARVVLATILLLLGCGDGTCASFRDCASNQVCRFPPMGVTSCGMRGTCVDMSDCFAESRYQPTPPPGDYSYGVCACSGTQGAQTIGACVVEPIVTSGATGCYCDTFAPVHFSQIHAGPRSVDEPCVSNGVTYPANCCDCSLAVPGASCRARDYGLPSGCCNCFTQATPDPTGRCAPPGGWTLATAQWCCAIELPLDGG